MLIQVFGPGCVNCLTLEKRVKQTIASLEIDAQYSKIEDFQIIMAYGIMRTPALAIDGKVVSQGRVPTVNELKEIINGELNVSSN
jgi:small redox-active disulfide protein 2